MSTEETCAHTQTLTRELDNLTPVQQRGRDGVEGVGRADEQDLAEIDGYVDVVVLWDVEYKCK